MSRKKKRIGKEEESKEIKWKDSGRGGGRCWVLREYINVVRIHFFVGIFILFHPVRK